MGQYYYVVNKTRGEFIHPHRLGDGLKLLEFGASGCGTMLALALLLADGNGRGGGDLRIEGTDNAELQALAEAMIGRWAGDAIVIAGDYADEGNHLTDAQIAEYREYMKEHPEDLPPGCDPDAYTPTLHAYATTFMVDISDHIRAVMMIDRYTRGTWAVDANARGRRSWTSADPGPFTADGQLRVPRPLDADTEPVPCAGS